MEIETVREKDASVAKATHYIAAFLRQQQSAEGWNDQHQHQTKDWNTKVKSQRYIKLHGHMHSYKPPPVTTHTTYPHPRRQIWFGWVWMSAYMGVCVSV